MRKIIDWGIILKKMGIWINGLNEKEKIWLRNCIMGGKYMKKSKAIKEVLKTLDFCKYKQESAQKNYLEKLNNCNFDEMAEWFAEGQKYNILIAYYTGKLEALKK